MPLIDGVDETHGDKCEREQYQRHGSSGSLVEGLGAIVDGNGDGLASSDIGPYEVVGFNVPSVAASPLEINRLASLTR